MIPQQQISTVTWARRHTSLLLDLRTSLADRLSTSGTRVLSFGCSTGLECLDIAEVIPEAEIYGCEINLEALEQAKLTCEGRATILESREDLLQEHGPFDAIVAFNVLCLYPETKFLDQIAHLYPFELFDQTLCQIGRLLRPGGFLAIYNAQYFFEDFTDAAHYEPVDGVKFLQNGWIEKALPSGERITEGGRRLEGIVHSIEEWKTLMRNREKKKFVLANPDAVVPSHRWLRPEAAVGRSTTQALWRKKHLES